MSSKLLIDVQQVTKRFPVGHHEVEVLKDISFQVHEGEFVAIVGQSGSGKSTLLNMLTGVDRPTSGEVFVNGQRLKDLSEDGLAHWRRREIGIVFQFFNLVPGLTVAQNIRLPMELADLYTPLERTARVAALLDQVGLAERATWLPSRVSGGDQQRAAIARANANDPRLIFGDEPTGRQDPRSAAACFDLFQEWVDTGKTFLMVTHSRALAARTGRTIELADGRVIRDEVH
ncbi:MAG: ABC transporter ATP-binding protein [Anaerolineales bacterium]|nr:ABC transporter ATP-binding protein [Anaerolineales bacterium]